MKDAGESRDIEQTPRYGGSWPQSELEMGCASAETNSV